MKDLEDRLGGEFDYISFGTEVEDIMTDYQQEKDKFILELKENDIYIPEKPTKEDRQYFEQIQSTPSILDQLKGKVTSLRQRITPALEGRDTRTQEIPANNAPLPAAVSDRPVPTAKRDVPNEKSLFSKPKTTSIKPDYLRAIQTNPLPCKINLAFKKLQPGTNDYDTYFEKPDQKDAEEVNQRAKEAYGDVLIKEYLAQNDNKQEKSQPRQDHLLPPTVRRAHEFVQAPDNDSTKRDDRFKSPLIPFTGNNTQELINNRVGRRYSSENPSEMKGNDSISKDQPSFHEDFFKLPDSEGKDPKEEIVIDENGRRQPNEDLLKNRIEENMSSIKEFFRSKGNARPLMGFKDESAVPERLEEKPELRKERKEINPVEADELAKQISQNILQVLNGALAQARPQPFSDTKPLDFSKPAEPFKTTEPAPLPQPLVKEAPQPPKKTDGPKHNLDEYYQTLESFFNKKQQQPKVCFDHSPLIDNDLASKLDEYRRQLRESSPRGRPGAEQSLDDLSEGEVKKGALYDSFAQINYDAGEYNRDRSEGELSYSLEDQHKD